MDVSDTRRIVIVGKTGAGKSSLANTIFGEKLFKIDHTLNSGTKECQAETRCVNGKSITLIDTLGFFDTERSEEELKREIVRCITECAPGPHAFLIVLKVEKFTEHEQAVIDQIHQYFSEEAFKYATVVFTHGDQLPEGRKIEDFVHQNKLISDLVKKCGERCHVIDNKYWKNNQQDEYRSNQFQVKELLKTIDTTTETNKGCCYTNETLKAVEEEIQQEQEHVRESSENMSEEEIRELAEVRVSKKLSTELADITTSDLFGALFGFQIAAAVGVAVGVAAARAARTAKTSVSGVVGAAGTVTGGVVGYEAAEGADTPREAAKRAAAAIFNKAHDDLDGLSHPKLKLSRNLK